MADRDNKVEQGTTEITVQQETASGRVIAEERVTRQTEVSKQKEQQIAQSIGLGF